MVMTTHHAIAINSSVHGTMTASDSSRLIMGNLPGHRLDRRRASRPRTAVNVPLHCCRRRSFARVADEIFKPVVEKFRPQMLFISAGFDAHWSDPLTSLDYPRRDFQHFKKTGQLAEEYCRQDRLCLGRRLMTAHVANGAAAVFDAIDNSTSRKDAGDPSPHREQIHGIHVLLKFSNGMG